MFPPPHPPHSAYGPSCCLRFFVNLLIHDKIRNFSSFQNENTSPQYMLHVIQHLRKELAQKETRIRDLEGYVDRMLSRVIETHPELLQADRA